MQYLEKVIIIRALVHHEGNQKKAAKTLGLNYTTINGKIKKYKIK